MVKYLVTTFHCSVAFCFPLVSVTHLLRSSFYISVSLCVDLCFPCGITSLFSRVRAFLDQKEVHVD